MAEVIEQFPSEQRRATRRYPWDDWADGRIWKLRRGEDFDANPDQFRNRLYSQAKKRGLEARTSKTVEEDGTEVLVFQMVSRFEGSPLPAEGPADANGASPPEEDWT